MNTDLIQPEPMKEEQLEYLKKMNIDVQSLPCSDKVLSFVTFIEKLSLYLYNSIGFALEVI